ncbi:tRNA lysidine(34) synthetase TilS [Acetanaerobacterium elongatum]|uniref:tRNA(Ile)-lysidine synthase n=1 Tax=Acetanaerobacterium elongatum TaxID=258515 RepID=A0A1H0BRD4_9FIRM|nr:tRNA lysidine(34) synthetase TilS [Acetanaerobacterium elongatum]SDN48103.1 tRNA(Ile)-lysidine synthase [Acetanaerobacterium elongatum]
MKAKALASIEQYSMLSDGGPVLVCVSGGADSMALLHLLYSIREQYSITLSVCHVNHGIRGKEALRDQRLVEDTCRRIGIPCKTVAMDVPALARERGLSLEECGRQVRYEAFERLANQFNARIATAHTLSDSIETMLLNLARGTGLKGLCGIPPVRGRIIRPLIAVTREEVEQYCLNNNIKYETDSTNLQRDYARNRIRMDIIPVLKEINPSLEQTIARELCALSGDEEFINSETIKALNACEQNGRYKIDLLLTLNPAILNRAVLTILKRYHVLPQSGHVHRIAGIIKQNGGCVTLTTNTYAEVKDGFLSVNVHNTSEAIDYCVPFCEGESLLGTGLSVMVTVLPIKEYQNTICSKKIHPNLLKNGLDYDKIIRTAVFRPRKEGDKLTLTARRCTKTLKKLFNEQKIPPEQRGLLPVLADETGVLWVEGFGCSPRAEITEATKRVAVIDIIR